ncbi:hypothetical protein EVJ58_g11077 [Rhodofomes roseus]|uniref:Uncharacterized protein n=1 Tax=Rhodofomes roseus TaxID=34475 RepID=A0A4Y9XPC0_9APHY|nr:hypothetical protein EVJ58_g11077 [Rhodofomes roseus]
MLTVSPELNGWALAQSFHQPSAYPASLQLDVMGASRAYELAMDMAGMDETMATTNASRRLPSEGTATLRFHSTLQPQRHSPQTMQQHYHPHRTAILGNDLSRDPTTMMLHQAHAAGEDQQMLFTQVSNTTTAASLAPSLGGSPSWSSAMSQMGMPVDQHQLDQFYRYQQHQARAQQQHANVPRHQPSRGPPPPDSSRVHHNSHLSTAMSHQSQQQAQNSAAGMNTGPRLSAAQAQRYSLELRRQQEEQLRKQQEHLRWQQHEAAQEREREREEVLANRRFSEEEEEYMQRIAQTYGTNVSPHPLDTHQVQLGQDGHPYYTQGYPVMDQAHLSLADGDAEEYQHHQQMLDGAYHLVDGPDQLDLSLEVHGASGAAGATGQSPEGMIKYESPLPLE